MSANPVILQCQLCIDVTRGVYVRQGMCVCQPSLQCCTSTQKVHSIRCKFSFELQKMYFWGNIWTKGADSSTLGHTRGTCDARYVCVSAKPAILYFNTEVHSSLRTWSTICFGQNSKLQKIKAQQVKHLNTFALPSDKRLLYLYTPW